MKKKIIDVSPIWVPLSGAFFIANPVLSVCWLAIVVLLFILFEKLVYEAS